MGGVEHGDEPDLLWGDVSGVDDGVCDFGCGCD
jgi:hypothetical protein